MIQLHHVWWLAAAVLAAATFFDLRARRWGNALFWGILAAVFAGGDAILVQDAAGNHLPTQLVGVAVVVMALLAGTGGVQRAAPGPDETARREASAQRLGHRLFVPALMIPAVTTVLFLLAPFLVVGAWRLLPAENATVPALALGCCVALLVALYTTRSRPQQALAESSRLLDQLSWAIVLPMLLAALGRVFEHTGVGAAVASLIEMTIPTDSKLACTLAYGLGMIVFTMIMGNAFAAFPVMTAGIGLPLLIRQHGGDPAVIGALGMLTGYCGTLLTPMAANFNIVPAVLLELKDSYGVIRAQAVTAALLACVNILLMYLLAFR
ncbi:DUF979 domain-containing protein [Tahibacter harae]|uniref:DUF979 domain-containing protein n=1 Tax=Tahibacter harae TaxID=2963937 RepID=A0ABT1QRS6_9GAMM|nr:DUF979 domain-containing protein [Tahibacter harae]MCQ4164966.1 DUF979 domain-containing protein [Tahibacter harae]